jgi:hypothetical protein
VKVPPLSLGKNAQAFAALSCVPAKQEANASADFMVVVRSNGWGAGAADAMSTKSRDETPSNSATRPQREKLSKR